MSRAVAKYPEVRAVLEDADNGFDKTGPLRELSKLLLCVQKSSAGDLIKWTILCLHDQFRAGFIPREGFSTRQLAGSKGEKGLIDQAHFRYRADQLFTIQ